MAAQKRNWGNRVAPADAAKDALRGAARRRLVAKQQTQKSLGGTDRFQNAMTRGMRAGVATKVTGRGTSGSERVPFVPRTATGKPAAGTTPRGFSMGDFTKGASGNKFAGPAGNLGTDGRPVGTRFNTKPGSSGARFLKRQGK